MTLARHGRDGTAIVKRAGRGSSVVRTIATPAGTVRMISKDVFDRALRSANTVLKQGAPTTGGIRAHGIER